MLRRFFSGLGSLLEAGATPSAFLRTFNSLSSSEIYQAKHQDKLVKLLHELTVDYKKRYNTANITELTTQPAVKKMIQQLPSTIKELSPDNAVKLMRSLAFMKIRDKNVWSALERRFSLVLHQISDESNIVYAIESFSRVDQDSPRLWNALESALLTTICPKHSLSPRSVAAILHCFSSVNKGSQQLMEAMEQQVMRVAPYLEASDLTRIVLVLSKMRYNSAGLFKLLNRQLKLICSKMSAHELSMVLCIFIRMKHSTIDLLEAVESVLKLHFRDLSGRNIATVMEAYTIYYKEHVIAQGPRRDFLTFLTDETFKTFDQKFPQDSDTVRYMITFSWSVSSINLNHNLALIKRILDEIRSRPIPNPQDYSERLKVIQKFIQTNHIA